jgi:acyl-CoA synthetase (AMP-forming)/AMP-acid ligase II
MSETCATVVGHRFDTPREHLRNSTGRVLPGTTLKVIDPTTGESLGVGEHGELALKGSTVLDHYVGRPRGDTFDDDGYLRTGDIGFVDAEGFVHWTGRRTEMIKTGGANVSPAELEVALRACAPVKRAKVVGIPDERLGQVVVLCVVLKAEATASGEELTSFLAERVAKYKVPRHVLFFDDGALPTTASDTKVRDDELVALVLDRLAAR